MKIDAPTIIDYTNATPTTVTVGAYNYVTNAVITLTGTVSLVLVSASRCNFTLEYIASTSFNGTSGDVGDMRTGPDVVMCITSEL